MDFDFSDDQQALRQVVRSTLAAEASRDYVREMLEDERGFTDGLWRRLAELGWTGLLVPKAHGGLGLLADLYLAIDEYAVGYPQSIGHFMSAAQPYIEMVTWHMEREDQILFRLAEDIFEEADKFELDRAFRQAESKFGPGLPERYERIALELERTWAV